MESLIHLLVGLFVPLFPFSMVIPRLSGAMSAVGLRIILLLAWPQLGVLLMGMGGSAPPEWLLPWGLFTSVLYAVRALVVRDMALWVSYIAISSWALLWVAYLHGAAASVLHLYAFLFSAPLVLLSLLGAALESRFGAAYTGLYGGLGQTLPRFSVLLTLVVLAVVATPLFPTFAVMISMFLDLLPSMPLAVVVLSAVWLLWSWAGARLLHDLVVGPPAEGQGAADLGVASISAFAVALLALVVTGAYLVGGLT